MREWRPGADGKVLPTDTAPHYTLVPDHDEDEIVRSSTKEEMLMTHFQMFKEGKYTIVPENNILLDIWDMLVISALFLTAILLPYDVALFTVQPTLFLVVNRAIDVIFLCDIVLGFCVAYETHDATSLDSYERAPTKIARYYLSCPFTDNLKAGWFWPDALTIMPWDALVSSNAYMSSKMGSVRMIRVLRLLRMFRLVRVVKLFKRWHTHMGYSYAMLEVLRTLVLTTLIVHWLACLWAALGVNGRPGEDTWLSYKLKLEGKYLEDLQALEVYNSALCFSMEILTTVGLGDVGPQTNLETFVTTVSMLFTGLVWAWVVATFVNILTNMDIFKVRFNQLMDDLNGIMHTRNLQPNLRWRLRKYLHEAFYVHRQRHQQETIRWLSAGLQGELAIQSGVDKVCHCVWYLRDLTPGVLVDIAHLFVSDMFSPNEFLQDKTTLSVVRKGTCFYKGRFVTRDAVIGEDMILVSEHLMDRNIPRTITFVEVMSLSRDSLATVCEKHHDFNRKIRRAQIKLAVWRSLVHEARALKMAEKNGLGSMGVRSTKSVVWANCLNKDNYRAVAAASGPSGALSCRLSAHVHAEDAAAQEDVQGGDPSETPAEPAASDTPAALAPVCPEVLHELCAEVRNLGTWVRDCHHDVKWRLERIDRRLEILEADRQAMKTSCPTQ